MIKIVDFEITPEFARSKINNLYMPLYKDHIKDHKKIEQYSELMKTGNWKKGSIYSPISFSIKGELMNGFHRLSAIIDSNVTIFDKIAENIPELVLSENNLRTIINPDKFVLCCAEFILDFLEIPTRNIRTTEKVYNNIFEKVKRYSNETITNRIKAAFILAIICAIESGISEDSIYQSVESIDHQEVIPNKFFIYCYKKFLNIEAELIKIPIEKLLPSDIYEVVKKWQE